MALVSNYCATCTPYLVVYCPSMLIAKQIMVSIVGSVLSQNVHSNTHNGFYGW